MSDLDKLIEAVEAGAPSIWLFYEALPREIYDRGFQAYHGSLDAAKALHEALLGDVHWFVNNMGEACVMMSADGEPNFKGDADNPARAWLLAIIKAYRAQVQQ